MHANAGAGMPSLALDWPCIAACMQKLEWLLWKAKEMVSSQAEDEPCNLPAGDHIPLLLSRIGHNAPLLHAVKVEWLLCLNERVWSHLGARTGQSATCGCIGGIM